MWECKVSMPSALLQNLREPPVVVVCANTVVISSLAAILNAIPHRPSIETRLMVAWDCSLQWSLGNVCARRLGLCVCALSGAVQSDKPVWPRDTGGDYSVVASTGRRQIGPLSLTTTTMM